MARVTAVIDIGSNSARMAVFERTSRFGFHLIREVKSRVRISEDTYENDGHLQPIPIERATKVIKEFVNAASAMKARKIMCVATSAVRDAPNRAEFVSKIKSETGIQIKVIEGEREAYFGAVAALNLLPLDEAITIDIGGGSTECAHIKDGKIECLYSLNIGTIRLKELFFDRKVPIQEAIEFVKKEMAKLPDDLLADNVVGIGGTIRALSKAIMKKSRYPIDALHGYEFNANEENETFERIANTPVLKLDKFYIKEDRFDTIREGALIFHLLINRFKPKKVITSGVGVREGVFLHDMLRNTNGVFPKGLNPSVRSVLDRFCCDEMGSSYRQKLAITLFDELSHLHKLDESYKMHLRYASKMLRVGTSMGYYDNQAHGSYIVKNGLMYGFTHKDRLMISLLIGLHNKRVQANIIGEDVLPLLPDFQTLNWLNFILNLAEDINSDLTKPKVEFEYRGGALYIYSKEELYLAREAIKKIQKPMPFAIIFQQRD